MDASSLFNAACACETSSCGVTRLAITVLSEKPRSRKASIRNSASCNGADSSVVTTMNEVSCCLSTASTSLARFTKPSSMVRNNVKNSVISLRNRAPRMRSATKKNGFAASENKRDCACEVSNFNSRDAKNSFIRRGASNTSSALREGGVSTMTKS